MSEFIILTDLDDKSVLINITDIKSISYNKYTNKTNIWLHNGQQPLFYEVQESSGEIIKTIKKRATHIDDLVIIKETSNEQ